MNFIKEYKEEIVMIVSTLLMLGLMLWAFSQQGKDPNFTRQLAALLLDIIIRSFFILVKLVGF